jgi:hypothetical protein
VEGDRQPLIGASRDSEPGRIADCNILVAVWLQAVPQ